MAKKIKRKIIVSGRPRSGTSLMMRILDVSGYKCARDEKWEQNLKGKIDNPYFYETRDLIKGKKLSLQNYDAGKILVDRLDTLDTPENYFIIWMHRNKESIFKSWDSYNRSSLAKIDNFSDYNRFDEEKILKKFKHVIIDYDSLIGNPKQELKKFTKLLKINKTLAIKEIDPNLRHF